jgi:hypothetical protein
MTLICHFPAPYIKPCARSDPHISECATKHANEAIPHLIKGKFNTAWVGGGLGGGIRCLVLRKIVFCNGDRTQKKTKEVGDAF